MILLRPWQHGDEGRLVHHADNRRVWRNLTDRFPHPYRWDDAHAWVAQAGRFERLPEHFAIVVDGEVVGGAGCERLADLARRSAEVGYWIGEAHWGLGFATRALRLLTDYAFEHFDFERLQAGVLDWNPASRRVLEKAGYRLESRQQRAAFKDGVIADLWLYVRLRGDS